MKKILMFLLAAFVLFGVAACGETETTTEEPRTYVADGEYTAFEVTVHRGAPQVTEVTVTIENDEITEYYIDVRQSSFDGENNVVWNEETKKELGFDYGMVEFGGAELEWFEQAELIEAYWLENGYDAVTTDGDGYIDNVADVSISDSGYSDLAAEAVQNAIDGVFIAYEVAVGHSGAADVTWAELTVDEAGEVTELMLDVRQSEVEVVEEEPALTWNDQTKQELGDDYGMVEFGGATYEWYEQANMITDYIVENGFTDGFMVSAIDDLADVSITTDSYEAVLDAVFEKVA